ncbi:MAG TPA: glycosyltransferase family 87 protein [Candidatus Ozemobacteraceae bacterium]|nr:glycosyltransferase family 87 protein [Candidatus Ozemobacteraceae bacterium]
MLFPVSYVIAIQYFLTLYVWYAEVRLNDFGRFLWTAKQMWGGDPDPYAPGVHTLAMTVGEQQHLLDMNPPQFHLLLYPLLGLSNEVAAGIWLLMQMLAWIASLALIQRTLGLAGMTVRTRVGLLFLILLATPTIATLVTGQFTFILLLLVTLGWRDIRAKRWVRGSVFFGIGLGVKAFFLILLPWFLLRRKWAAAGTFLGTAASMYLLGYILHGPNVMASWMRALHSVHWLWLPMNASLPGFLDRVFDHSHYFIPLVDWSGHMFLLQAAFCGIAGFVTVRAVARSAGKDVDHELAVLLVSSQLLQPLGFFYLFPRHPFFTMTSGSVYFWALFALWLALILFPRCDEERNGASKHLDARKPCSDGSFRNLSVLAAEECDE